MTKLFCNISKVLFLCLILFAVSVSASAESDSSTVRQYGLGNLDFEADSVGSKKYAVSSSEKYSVDRFGDKQGNHTVLIVEQSEGNKYLRFKDNGKPRMKPPYDPYWKIYTNKVLAWDDGYYVNSFSTDAYDFLVVDFELAADEYLYTYTTESATDMTTVYSSVPEGAQIIATRPAYPEGLIISNEIAGIEIPGAPSQQKHNNRLKLVSEGSEWYVYVERDGIFVNTGARLKSEILKWNHFTVVIAIDRENGNRANSMQYTYLNGDFVAAQYVGDSQRFADFSCVNYGIELPYEVINDDRFLYSFGLDNFSINYYMRADGTSEYSSEGYGLDDYFRGGDTKKGIYNCEDIVYGNSYISKNAVASVNDVYYYSMSEALSAVTEGCTLRLYRSLDNYTPTVKGLTVIADASLNFALSPEAVHYSCTDSSDGGVKAYTVTYKESESEGDGDFDLLLKAEVFSGAKYNLTTSSSFTGNFYVKQPEEDARYGIYIGEGSGYVEALTIDGVSYYKFSSEPLITDITAKITFDVKVTVSGEEKTFTAEYTLDEYFGEAMAYLSAISSPTEYQTAQMKLIMNAVRYANELYKYVRDVEIGYEKYEQILTNGIYRKYLTAYGDLGINENAESDFIEISSVVVGAGLAVRKGYRVSFLLYLKDGAQNAESLKLYYRSVTGEIKESKLNPTEAICNEDTGFSYLISPDVPIYEMLSLWIITLEDESGEVLTGKYTLGAYISSNGSSETEDLARAMYAYAKAAYQYKTYSE